MSQKSRVSLGPGAASLILIVVILSMSVPGILALMNARSDSRLSRHSIEVVAASYALSETSERSLSALDAAAALAAETADTDEAYAEAVRDALPAGMTMTDRQIAWTETDGYRTLECAVQLETLGAEPRLTWRVHRLTAITEGAWN